MLRYNISNNVVYVTSDDSDISFGGVWSAPRDIDIIIV